MAAGYLGKPGTEFGPCGESCGHTDCRYTRDMAAAPCRLCGKPIGYDSGFFEDGSGPLLEVLVHAPCLYRDMAV